jgi:hypothetical protein
LVNIKGLELQETSCHTREAQYIDDSFEATFENGNTINQNKFDCLKSCDVLILKTYSDAKNTLVGILDSPDCQAAICQFYPKILHYFILKYLLSNKASVIKEEFLTKQNINSNIQTNTINLISKTDNLKPNNRLSPIQQRLAEFPDINHKANNKLRKLDLTKEDSLPEWSDNDSLFEDFLNDNKKKKKKSLRKIELSNTKSDDFDASIFDIFGGDNQIKNNFELKSVAKSSNTYDDEIVSNNSIISIPSKWLFLLKNLDVKQNDEVLKNLKSTITSNDWFNKLLEIIDKKNVGQTSLSNDYQNSFNLSHFNFLAKCLTCLGIFK